MNKNVYLFSVSVFILALLIPTILFYFDLCYHGYPYLFHIKNDVQGLKKHCGNFLDKHFNCKTKGIKNIQNKQVIYIINHHDKDNKLLDMLYHLKIPGNNSIVITGGKTRYEVIKNLYTNLNTIKLSKEDKGNINVFLRKCKKKLDKGNNIVIFPEGKFTDKKENWDRLFAFQSGAFILSKQYNIPIVPVIISGSSYRNGLIIHPNITMKYLSPLYPDNYDTIEEYKNEALDMMNLSLVNIEKNK